MGKRTARDKRGAPLAGNRTAQSAGAFAARGRGARARPLSQNQPRRHGDRRPFLDVFKEAHALRRRRSRSIPTPPTWISMATRKVASITGSTTATSSSSPNGSIGRPLHLGAGVRDPGQRAHQHVGDGGDPHPEPVGTAWSLPACGRRTGPTVSPSCGSPSRRACSSRPRADWAGAPIFLCR